MPWVHIGDLAIEYAVRASSRAVRTRIVMSVEGVEVVTPSGMAPAVGAAFVERKLRWLFDATRAVEARRQVVGVQRWGSGAKVQFRGRWCGGAVAEVACRAKFVVTVPAGLGAAEEAVVVRDAMRGWLGARAAADAERWVRQYTARLGWSRRGCGWGSRCIRGGRAAGWCGADQSRAGGGADGGHGVCGGA